MPKAVGYVRVSEEEQAKGYSPKFQTEFIGATISTQGWGLATDQGATFEGRNQEETTPGFFVDLGGHGWDINRPALRAMILAGKARKFDRVVVWRQDRLSRVYEDISLILRTFMKFGVSVYLDGKLWEPKDALVVAVKAAVSEEELRKLKDGTKRGLAEAKKEGIVLGKPPTGLQKSADKTKLEPTEMGRGLYGRFENGEFYETLAAEYGITVSKAARIVRNVRALEKGTLGQLLEEEREAMYERKRQMKLRENKARKEFSDWLRSMAGFEFE